MTVPDDNSKEALKVMIVDDHPIVREAVSRILQEEGYVVSTANDGARAVELAASLRPHLVVMDVRMPGMSGIEATRQLRMQDPTIRILMFSMRNDPETVLAALEAGATSYLSKEASGDALPDAVRRTLDGQAVFVPGNLVNVMVHQSTRRSNIDPLTLREQEIAKLAVQGLTNRQIAQKLHLSSRTVENHLSRIFSKLGVESRTKLAKLATNHSFDRYSDITSDH